MQGLDTTEMTTRIRERAYAIWEAEGCPNGCAERHWSAAEEELLYSDAAPDRDVTAARMAPLPTTRKRAKA